MTTDIVVFFFLTLHVLGSPTKLIIDDNAMVLMFMNLLNVDVTVFEINIKDKRMKLMVLPGSK